ncbi:uncharacterized protein EV422DRAFT_37833 [Fimicolochytrium jonesii]|uniref:uncharacterized protein n=1 Tax=Fimicolochytrium jonesii TaxID=1396493 RepID=UPI0022FED5AF|nr:uncharacterized protein EV422DRAFT_37833 [Fimicolochytrium jonesii]KAI8821321.1 hypothetical protein EV422DRAFT_37833 [Fimicolochytrium jonesii]
MAATATTPLATPPSLPPPRKTYPSHVRAVSYGKALFADADLPAGTVVERFEGEVVEYDQVSEKDKTYVLNFLPPGETEWKWLLPTSDARFANHSCDPNAKLTNLQIILTRPVKKDEEITFLYNPGDDTDYWDPAWNFKCCCGSTDCQGDIDRYRKPKA